MQTGRKGGALLAVLWVSAILSAIAFSLANTVRAETERTSTLTESVRTYYLATGAIERLTLYTEWTGHTNPDGSPRYFQPGTPRVFMEFPTGAAVVELIPETAKLSVNTATPEELLSLLVNLGVSPERATQIVPAIVDWRSPAPGGLSLFDQHYLSLVPSFRSRHASFQEIEELLLVKGMTPDIFYGTFVRDEQGRLFPQAGLRDCLSVYSVGGQVDINYAPPAVLATIGLFPSGIAAIVQRRHAAPFRNPAEIAEISPMLGPSAARLSVGGSTIFTFRSTARLRLPDGRLSDLSRTVAAMLKFHPKPVNAPPIEVLRWYDN
jgi:general secretion pathway protein K